MVNINDNFRAGKVLASDRLSPDKIESALLLSVLSYWDDKRGEKFAPSLREFQLMDLPPPIIPYMTVIDFLGPDLDFFYRFFGTRMVEIVGRELTGKSLMADGVLEYGVLNARAFPIMIEERNPLCTRTKWVSQKELEFDTVTIRLPLSDNGNDVTGGVMALQFADRSAERESLTT